MKTFKAIILTVATSLISLSSTYKQDKPKILIIGDSISIGYTPFVKENLAEQAEVFHNPGNAQHTGTGLQKIEKWIGDEDWDIIHFNWGLWDLCYRLPNAEKLGKKDKINGVQTFSAEEYASNLDMLVSWIKNHTDARLIFVTTTYVPVNELGRYKSDALKYNKAAKKVMAKNNITVNDIYKSSKSIHKKYGKGDNDVHYTPEGYKALAEIISQFLEKEIKKMND
jgi:lysophospholipase L1-like esterase